MATTTPITDDMRAQWDRALAAFEIRDALMLADEQFGAYAEAIRAFDWEIARLQDAHGTRDRAKWGPEGSAAWERVWKALQAAEQAQYDQFIVPVDQAAVAVASTPAPDHRALRRKVEIIKYRELDNYTGIETPPMEFVAADARRLLGEVA